MTPIERSGSSHQMGFSLLEMVVAIAILALALGALYQAASGATRNVRTAERYAYAVELARSLLADNAMVPAGGANLSGETGSGYQWRVVSRPRQLSRGVAGDFSLHDIEVEVGWFDGSKRRQIVLNSVVEALPLDRR